MWQPYSLIYADDMKRILQSVYSLPGYILHASNFVYGTCLHIHPTSIPLKDMP